MDINPEELLAPTDASGDKSSFGETVWGLTPSELHDRYWASRGVCVVRPGEPMVLPSNAELFMLTDGRIFCAFALGEAASVIYWNRLDLLFVRVNELRRPTYKERFITSQEGYFRSFSRIYESPARPANRIALTRNRELAEAWQSVVSSKSAWQALRTQSRSMCKETFVTKGTCFDRRDPVAVRRMVQHLVEHWEDPALTIDKISKVGDRFWVKEGTDLDPTTVKAVGTVWIGCGRVINGYSSLIGPAVLWDTPESRPLPSGAYWAQLEPTEQTRARSKVIIRKSNSAPRKAVRRLFDVVFSLIAIAITLPLYPIIALLILIEDGLPIFFFHRRETIGGREFRCVKFRTMRKNAEQIKQQLQPTNESDGPQFFMKNDPRVTRIGRILRATNLDEIPQFFNVLIGDMSIVGPRPSPRHENQCCPAWREARLSLRPGITGLWQVSRTRRNGLDFQEWIRFDMEYVERQSLFLDLRILVKTFLVIIRRG